MERSLEKITTKDLHRLLKLARENIDLFFTRNPIYKEYKDKEVIIALGQGAALHYIDGKNGVKDFDVWLFYPKKKATLPYRRRGVVDYGESKFGKHPKEKSFVGRRVDVLMRSDSNFNKGKPEECLINYLTNKKSKTAVLLSKKAMIGLWPNSLLGRVIWKP